MTWKSSSHFALNNREFFEKKHFGDAEKFVIYRFNGKQLYMKKLYPESKIELTPFISKHYDALLNYGSFGVYQKFIQKVITEMKIQSGDSILDMGCGTGSNSDVMSGYISDNGNITGLDVSDIMEKHFCRKFSNDKRINFIKQRIDIPFDLHKEYDKVLISFVIHGFPHDIRQTILENAMKHLKPGGTLNILDFAEFDMDAMPSHHRFIFKIVECEYAFDYIKRDWKSILTQQGYKEISERFYFKNYLRLLKATK